MASIASKLLGISCFLSCGRSALAQGLVKTEVGSDVLLPCLFNEPVPDDEMVSWERKLANGSSVQVLVFHDKSTPRLPNIEWVGDLSRGNASVKISAVGIEDAGDYSCATFYSDINLSITLSVVLKVVEDPGLNNNNGETTIIVAAVALLVIAIAVVGFVIAMKMRERRRRSRDNESGTRPSTELQVLASAASTA
ncbi:myelin protein zero-like protein 3 [Lethenteron reissneri]|uniref:myelin protein zero-like protein 3 n=1 Tax=Lethenteron reissneri TaxID=7753 RepID=UPI002AB665D8|nr:myelin protein zero-like protein 3 [Lethenteron reissneri]